MGNQSRGRGQISELTHIAPITQGYIKVNDQITSIRYADRLRTVLGAFEKREDQGFPGVIRLFRGIHTVKWSMLDGDTRLMVNVVFDGTLNGYLRALARDVPGSLGLIWSNCEGWEDPSNDAQKLIDFIERHQVRVDFFYAQNPELTVPDVENLLHLREKFEANLSTEQLSRAVHSASAPISNEARLRALLQKYGSQNNLKNAKRAFLELLHTLYDNEVVDSAYLETFGEPAPANGVSVTTGAPAATPQTKTSDPVALASDIQSSVLSDYPKAHIARMFLLHFDDPERARTWLESVRDQISFGVSPETRNAQADASVHLNIGFTRHGLLALGASPTSVSQFPNAFLDGMDARFEDLGDPEPKFLEGIRPAWLREQAAQRPIHAVLFAHVDLDDTQHHDLLVTLKLAGKTAQDLAEDPPAGAYTRIDVETPANKLGVALRAALDSALSDLRCRGPSAFEAFVLGERDLHRPLVEYETVTGEKESYGIEYFGFRDGVGQPRLPSDADARNAPVSAGGGATAAPAPHELPTFDHVLRTDGRGLLKNATFLVARQLRQDPELFWNAMTTKAKEISASKRAIAEQIVGRRMNGQRLTSGDLQLPSRPYNPTLDREAFDPADASACPFHSHVRRVNPRVETSRTRNPRLVRRSLAFVDESASTEGSPPSNAQQYPSRGLMFLAYNADIETQFEFIQRHWVQAGNQVGLSSHDADVFSGLASNNSWKRAPSAPARFFAAHSDAGRELTFSEAFVRLEWGIYLYVPARKALELLIHGENSHV